MGPKTKIETKPIVVYYESIKRELKIKPISECRCDERLKIKAEESTCLGYKPSGGGQTPA